jgi:hypothetical protein
MPYAALLLVSVELFAASRIMPYNDLAPREVYLGQRFTISQMLAYHNNDPATGRMLAISQLYFDPGDLATLRARYERSGLDAEALHTAFTAVKKQEMLFPNLGLTWHIPTIDGFEGGILPTIYYSQLTSLLLPENSPRTLDGRLGEMLALPECRGACIPDERWLELTGTQFLITDKVYDVWQDGVAYDGAFPLLLDADESATLDDLLPDFAGTELRVLFSADVTDAPYARLTWVQSDGSTTGADLLLADAVDPLRVDGLLLATVAIPDASALTSLQIDAQLPLQIRALTLVDTRTGDFVQIPLRYPRVLSSDIKIYERDTSERAYLATQTTLLPDNWQGHEDGLSLMREEAFDPAQHAVVHGDQLPIGSSGGTVALIEESATTLAFAVQAPSDSWLIVRDAWYPGWQASIDGEPANVYRANVMFRAVRVPAGESTVRLSFTPTLWYGSIIAGGIAWVAALLLGAAALWRSRR